MKESFIRYLTCAMAALLLASCTSKPTKQAMGPGFPEPQTPGFIETEGPQETPAADPNFPVPDKAPVERPRVTLVLGGSGVASFGTVGLLKRLQEEGIKVDAVVTTGWPSLFALGFGFLKSVHDLEWFAMRLVPKDFQTAGLFKRGRNELSDHVQGKLKASNFEDSRIPIVISTVNPETGEVSVYDRGDWKEPLLITLAAADNSEKEPPAGKPMGIDVREAFRRDSRLVVAVQMYDDVLFSTQASNNKPQADFHKLLKSQIAEDSAQAQVTGRITLGKSPDDFAQKRAAIMAGYKEGTRLAKKIRGLMGNANRTSP